MENHLSLCHENVETTCGPLWYKQYYTWTARSKSQFTNDRIKRILEKYPQSTPSILNPDQGPVLIMVHGLTCQFATLGILMEPSKSYTSQIRCGTAIWFESDRR